MKQGKHVALCPRTGGFSMIELSIVFIIIGLIISAGISVFGPSMRQALKGKNDTIVQDAVKAVVGYAGAQKKVPADMGGVARSFWDAQQNTLKYAYSDNLISENSVCDQRTTHLKVSFAYGESETVVDNVAFVVWSRGGDGMTTSDNQNPFDLPSTNRTYALSSAATYTVPVYSEKKDDLSGWVTLYELKAAAGCGPALRILNNRIKDGQESLYSGDTIAVDGGVLPYSWCIDDSGGDFPSGVTTNPSGIYVGPAMCDTVTFGNYVTTGENGVSIRIEGRPSVSNSYRFKLFVKDGVGNTATKIIAFLVNGGI
ncbi:MAG: hypothetical protein H7839_09300 [Magnetococcus sp. YQC-5]